MQEKSIQLTAQHIENFNRLTRVRKNLHPHTSKKYSDRWMKVLYVILGLTALAIGRALARAFLN